STQAREVPVWTYRDDLTWTKGSHGLSFGGSLKTINQQTNLTNDFNFATVGLGGVFPSSLGTGAAITSLRPTNILNAAATRNSYDSAFAFLLGTIPSVATRFNYNTTGQDLPLSTGRIRDWRYVEYEFYGQDNWKVRNDLTITYGVRWHIYPAPYETKGLQSIQGQDQDFESIFNRRVQNGAAGIATPTSEPFLVYNLGGKANDARPFYETEYNNFGPRLAFAWNPSASSGLFGKLLGDRKTVIRGGATVTYDRPGGGITFLQDQNTYIFDTVRTNNFPAANGRVGLLNFPRFTNINSVPVQNVAPTITRPFTPGLNAAGVGVGSASQLTNYAVDPNFRIPYSVQYTFGFQRELPGNFIFEASYVGRQARQLFVLADAAQVVDFVDPASGQSMIGALNILQQQIQTGAAITAQPWFENQIGAVLGGAVNCTPANLGSANCTEFAVDNFGFEISIGDTADTIQGLRAAGALRPNVGLSSQFATNAFVTNKGSSSYDGMLLSLRKRFSKGFQFDVNYTWSHSLDNQSTVANTSTSGGLICDATNLRVCRGNSDFDIRHLLNVNGIWELPIGRGHMLGGNAPGWLNQIIGGWELTGILTARSGLPFHLATTSWPRSFIFDAANGVPVVLSGDSSALKASIHDTTSGIQFFADPDAALAAVSYPRHGQIGNRNVLRSQPFWNVDTAVLKNFKLGENHRIQLRWESYNLFNHNVFAPPSTANDPNSNALNIGATNFGIITTVQSTARVMQFGIRWDF
ncbi:MAG TPA: hypothetical protein VKA78_09025, partial [Pyrinomonadaceae bacterium]|nr:hypothetical protein [Pyrinomonadaceae bacterium]